MYGCGYKYRSKRSLARSSAITAIIIKEKGVGKTNVFSPIYY